MGFGKEIKRLREASNLSAQRFADIIGINAERLRKWEQRDMSPRYEDSQIIEAYFGLSLEDLMLLDKLPKIIEENEVSMVQDHNVEYIKTRRTLKNGFNEKEIPMYFGNTRAGTIQVYSDDPEMQTPVGHLPASIFPGCNHAEKISGDSMYPLICNQAYIIGKIIDKRGIIWGEKYIIHTKYGQSMVKYVHPSTEKQFIKIVSHNKTIPSQDLPLDDITFVCRVHFIVNPS